MEDASDPNSDSAFTFENIGNYVNNDIVLNGTDSSSTNAGDNILLNGIDSSSTDAGDKIVTESAIQYDFFTLSDIIKPSLLILDSHIDDGIGPTGGSTPVRQTAIILEESGESGFFMQEDGYKIHLENKT